MCILAQMLIQYNVSQVVETIMISVQHGTLSLSQKTVLSFTYPIDSDTVYGGKWRFEDNPMVPHRTVFVIDKKYFNDSIDELPQIQY